ncbi:UNKNOWN [Stylonychia lemnae]|uniref:Homeobox domain-containing protein n=1 Tax=Stylonychia lemnae TaxID=5949 RepID=A0A078AWE5_STYLE|nr:UNKNOWN [Stylonychia lemnae]|eukprot:CDW85567.1 UNKNOWN [Stylonychia lemnae]
MITSQQEQEYVSPFEDSFNNLFQKLQETSTLTQCDYNLFGKQCAYTATELANMIYDEFSQELPYEHTFSSIKLNKYFEDSIDKLKLQQTATAPNSAPISPSTCCSDLVPQSIEAGDNQEYTQDFSDIEDNDITSEVFNGIFDIKKSALQQIPKFNSLNDQVNYIVSLCTPESDHTDSDHRPERIIKLSKRNISEENLRKKKNTKSREQKAQLEAIFKKQPTLWEKTLVRELSSRLDLGETQVYKWNYDQFKRFQKNHTAPLQ